MTKRSNHNQNSPVGDEKPEVYSISQDKDGSIHFSRRDFIAFGAAIGGTLLVRGVCPRFGTKPTPSEPIQAGVPRLPGVYIHTESRIASNIVDTLQQNEFVRLIKDHPNLGWAEVATQRVQHGWVKRSFIDFSRVVKSSSPNFDLSNALNSASPKADPSLSFSVQLHKGDHDPKQVSAASQILTCGEIIQNGDFEAGSGFWVEDTPGAIVTDQWADPYQGSWVAWLGGVSYTERLDSAFSCSCVCSGYSKV